jgi:hypothetical protein
MTNDVNRWKYGLRGVLVAVVAILAVFVFAALRYSTASDVSTALAAVTGTLGTILGAYLGVQTGSAGRDQSEAARREAEEHARAFAAVAPPEAGLGVVRMLRETERTQETTEPSPSVRDRIEELLQGRRMSPEEREREDRD